MPIAMKMENPVFQLFLGAAGVYFSYIVSSIVTEKIMSYKYKSSDGTQRYDEFQFPCLITWLQCLFCSIFGFMKHRIIKERANPIPYKEQALLGLLFIGNYLLANYALMYVPYHVQVIIKSSRYIFVVFVAVFFTRVKKDTSLLLSKKKLITAVLITLGAIVFAASGVERKHQEEGLDDAWIGYLLLTCSMICDAFFGDSQAYQKAHFKPTSNHLFMAGNFFAFLWTIGISLFINRDFFQSLHFCWTHPEVIYDLLLTAVLQIVGQVSIYELVTNFKQHIYPLISTTRKIFTFVLSCIIYHHKILFVQAVSVSLVFACMAYELYQEITHKKIQLKQKQSKELKKQQESTLKYE